MAMYDICLSQNLYRKLFEICENSKVNQPTMDWLFGHKKLAFLGSSQYWSLECGENDLLIDRKDKSEVSPAHEFGSYSLGQRGRLLRRQRILDRLELDEVEELLLVETDVGPWVVVNGFHY